jgi:hypothetical protein
MIAIDQDHWRALRKSATTPEYYKNRKQAHNKRWTHFPGGLVRPAALTLAR